MYKQPTSTYFFIISFSEKALSRLCFLDVSPYIKFILPTLVPKMLPRDLMWKGKTKQILRRQNIENMYKNLSNKSGT